MSQDSSSLPPDEIRRTQPTPSFPFSFFSLYCVFSLSFLFFFSFSLEKFCFGGYPERIYWMMDDQHQMSSSITSLNKYWLYGQSHWRWIRLKSTGKTTSPFLLFLSTRIIFFSKAQLIWNKIFYEKKGVQTWNIIESEGDFRRSTNHHTALMHRARSRIH